MSNIKQVRIVADVPFDYLNWHAAGEGLPEAEVAAIASALLSPSTGLTYEYVTVGYRPNDHGGQTAMYRLLIGGEEALSWSFLNRLATSLKAAGGKLGGLHIAEAMDGEISLRWEHILDPADERAEMPQSREDWANRVAGDVAAEYEDAARSELPADASSGAHHACDVWGSIARAVAFSNAMWDSLADEADIRGNVESSMNYVQITADLDAAIRGQFGICNHDH
jgi:hypothetical protein